MFVKANKLGSSKQNKVATSSATGGSCVAASTVSQVLSLGRLSLLSSFGYFEDQREDLRMLRNLLTSLRPGGVCLVDVMGKEVLARIAQPTTSEIVDEDTTLVVRHEICSDWTRIRNEWLFIQGDKIRRYQFEHTVYSGQELRARLEQAGFVDVKLYGGFDGADYGLNARRLIAVGRKPLSRRGL